MSFITAFICACFLSWTDAATADATPSPRFKRISIEQGLSQSTVLCILQDREGYLWFGTEDGLNRYDGYSFTVFKNIPFDETSLSINTVNTMLETTGGDLWIGTASGGLNRYDRKTGRFIRYSSDPRNPATLSSNGIQSLASAGDGGLWVGTHTGGLNHFDTVTGACRRYLHDPANPRSIAGNKVYALCPEPNGLLWVGTDDGLDRFDPATEKFTHFLPNSRNNGVLSGSSVRALRLDRKGQLWVGTWDGGLERFDPRTKMTVSRGKYSANGGPGKVRSILEDRLGNIWVGSWGEGLGKFDPETGTWTLFRNDPNNPESLSGDMVLSLHEDAAGNIFAGTGYRGISMLPHNFARFSHLRHEFGNTNSLSGNHIWSVLEDRDGILWVSTLDNGLNRIDRKRNTYTCYRHDPKRPNSISSDTVLTLYEDRDGILWLGTDGNGLDRFDRHTGKVAHFTHNPSDSSSISANYIWSILEDSAGNFWVGTSGGLDRLDRKTGKCVHFRSNSADPVSLSSNYITALYETRAGEFWVGTAEGLNRMDRGTGRCTRYLYDPRKPKGLNYNRIWCFHEDRAGNLWIGTWGGGLNRYDPATDSFEHFTENDGLVNNTVYGILEDDTGALWMSTNRGLSRFNPKTRSFRNFTSQDGLQNEEYNVRACFRNSRGELFFGGINGLTCFRPENITEDPYAPPLVISVFGKGRLPIQPDSASGSAPVVRLKYGEAYISFEFSSLDYTAPGKNIYAHKLEGFDADWVFSGTRRYVEYTHLPPGTYVFRVRGTNGDGRWNETGASVHILVAPPFWGTWRFRIIGALCLAGLIFVAYTLRIKGMKDHQRKLERIVRERTESLHLSRDEIARKEKLYRSLVETSPDAIVMTDAEGKIVAANPQTARLFGFETVQEMMGMDFGELTGSPVAGLEEIADEQSVSSPVLRRWEFTVCRKNGERLPVELNCATVRDEDGTMRNRINIIRDISERKLAEEERIERERLKGIVALAGSACHELNQPLQAIVGYSELIMMQHKEENDFLQRIMNEANRMRNITRKLQNITRYHTKSYYGNERILDLDRSSGEEPPKPKNE